VFAQLGTVYTRSSGESGHFRTSRSIIQRDARKGRRVRAEVLVLGIIVLALKGHNITAQGIALDFRDTDLGPRIQTVCKPCKGGTVGGDLGRSCNRSRKSWLARFGPAVSPFQGDTFSVDVSPQGIALGLFVTAPFGAGRKQRNIKRRKPTYDAIVYPCNGWNHWGCGRCSSRKR
jgi:hypothetical protein